jgi:hypothetical protein
MTGLLVFLPDELDSGADYPGPVLHPQQEPQIGTAEIGPAQVAKKRTRGLSFLKSRYFWLAGFRPNRKARRCRNGGAGVGLPLLRAAAVGVETPTDGRPRCRGRAESVASLNVKLLEGAVGEEAKHAMATVLTDVMASFGHMTRPNWRP